jgi:pimeloyl-ACP methyl ester carboxylesterase
MPVSFTHGKCRNWFLAATLATLLLAPTHAQLAPILAQPASVFATASFSTVTGAGGVPLNVVEAGDKSLPAIVFIHGFRQSYLSWIEQYKSDLQAHCHLVAFDLRGHGNSGSPWQEDAYDSAAPWGDDVAKIIKATGITKPLIVGWSYGGNVAMDFARRHPDIPVSGYILVSTTAGMLKMPPLAPGAPVRPTASSNLQANIAGVDASVALLFPKSIDPAMRESFRLAAMRVSPYVDRAIVKRANTDNLDIVASLHVPITLVTGGKDPIVTPALAQRVLAALPKAKFVSFPDSGHALFVEEPKKFGDILEEAQCSRK